MTEDPVQLDGAMYVEVTNPSTGPAVVQFKFSGTSTSAGVTMDNAPLEGDWLFALHNYNGNSAATGWTSFHNAASESFTSADGTTHPGMYYKHAGAGESTTQTPTSGVTKRGFSIIEVSGLADTWIADGGKYEAVSRTVANWGDDLTCAGLTVDSTALVYITGKMNSGTATPATVNNADFNLLFSGATLTQQAQTGGWISLAANTDLVLDVTHTFDEDVAWYVLLLPTPA
jgi:hypothetical protein